MSTKPLEQYAELLRRLDEKFAEIQSKYPAEFSCRLGCHQCCVPNLTVGPLERDALRAYLQSRPEIAEQAKQLEAENPHGGTRCTFLQSDGGCLIYEARPLVCRSHGAPLQTRDPYNEQQRFRDVCPLNFTTTEIASLPAESVLNLDTLNTLLSLVTRLAHPEDESRTPLRVAEILR